MRRPCPSRPEGRTTLRRRFLLGLWILVAALLVVRAGEVQVVEASRWAEAADRQHRRTLEVPAPRGRIVDRDGVALAESHERYRVAVAPREIEAGEDEAVEEALVSVLDLTPSRARAAVRSSRPWVVLPGRYPPSVRERLAPVRGVHLERELERIYPHGDLARAVLGGVRDGAGRGGIEEAFDSLLTGRTGREVQARDHLGRPIPGESHRIRSPEPGHDVTLTLDLGLQEISREALERAIEETEARGGDLLITDPRSGEILSLVSIRDGSAMTPTAITTPYEPGSTLKPFTVAGLLARGLAQLSDTVDAEGGRWRVAGRTLTDVRPQERLSLADALRTSSNVGVAKAARAYAPAQQYEVLRDFGFGVPTGIELPGEAGGILRRPEAWSGQSPASLAIGYEIGVTPLQMAMAYGALANGGWLMEPRIVREIRGSEGSVSGRRTPRRIRRAVPEAVAKRLGKVLVDVVEEGTGTAARLSTFRVAGKSGTSRAYGSGEGYEDGSYYASFVGYFPAEDPQLVVFVKLERPRGPYYGGATAAPVTRATLEAILAARRVPMDRRALIHIARRPVVAPPVREEGIHLAAFTSAPSSLSGEGEMPGAFLPEEAVPVPPVSGLSVRAAVRRLHAWGLRVRWEGGSGPLTTVPAQGVPRLRGDTVRLRGKR